ncbi:MULTISPECIES: phage holin family protein [unclassified Micromonospora]|uniref:phage holin family protein n=1 Tax=unclassified Micromonospora TaxID=2617518 RepID=UPI001033C008|nr:MULTISPECIES: phage holin family protein [unclassified Micromonospora]QKW13189.1 phage holin family protein [Verrucosispora sp. NA02020]TBL32764.1 phage holin family protein [Verrucosispora sp. SN26_14.1]
MADVADVRTSHNGSEPSTAELVQRATEQVSRLVRDELALARAELTEKGKHAGIGVGLLAGGGALAFLGLGALITAAILLLALVLPAWAAALIVAAVVFLIAGVLALLGKKQVSQAVPPVPQATVQSLRADVDVVSAAVKDRGRA